MGDELYLVQMAFDMREMLRGRDAREIDLGYLTHCYLTETFGDAAPKPFALPVERDGQVRRVLGYASAGREALIEAARARAAERFSAVQKPVGQPGFARPSEVAWEALGAKRIPMLEAGTRLGFEVRVCPVVRLASAREASFGDDRQVVRKGAERDVYQREAMEAERRGEVFLRGREEVYRSWLAERLEGAATLEDARLIGFTQRRRLYRQTQGEERRRRMLERPDALMAGTLTVRDDGAFREVLRRGIGRHRAFGFGMLLVRAPGPSC